MGLWQSSGRDLAIVGGLLTVALGLLALATHLIEGSAFAHGQELIPPRPLPEVTWRMADGQAMALSQPPKRWRLLYFGYTYCPDVCPAALANLAQVLQRLGQQSDRLQVIFVSIDAKRDTPQAAQQFAAHFHPGFVGTVSAMDQATQVIRAAGTPFPFGSDAKAASAPDPTQHPTQFFLVDPHARLVAKYADDVPIADLTADLQACLVD